MPACGRNPELIFEKSPQLALIPGQGWIPPLGAPQLYANTITNWIPTGKQFATNTPLSTISLKPTKKARCLSQVIVIFFVYRNCPEANQLLSISSRNLSTLLPFSTQDGISKTTKASSSVNILLCPQQHATAEARLTIPAGSKTNGSRQFFADPHAQIYSRGKCHKIRDART